MKLNIVTQWVREGGTSQVPPDQSLANRSVANRTCIVCKGGCEIAASKSTGCVTEPRNVHHRSLMIAPSKGVKSTRFVTCGKTEASTSSWREVEALPGSVTASRACAHRGYFATWEGRLSPWKEHRRTGGPVYQSSKADRREHHPFSQNQQWDTNKMVLQGTHDRAKSEVTGDRQPAILVSHNTVLEAI